MEISFWSEKHIFEKYLPFVLNKLQLWGLNKSDAEDEVAYILLDLINKIRQGDFLHPDQIKKWLRTYARNVAVAHHRKHKKQRNVALENELRIETDDQIEDEKELSDLYDFVNDGLHLESVLPPISAYLRLMRNEVVFDKACLKIYALSFPFLRLERSIALEELSLVLSEVLAWGEASQSTTEATPLTFSDNHIPKKQRSDEQIVALLNDWSKTNEKPPRVFNENSFRRKKSRCKDNLEAALRAEQYDWYYFRTERKNRKF